MRLMRLGAFAGLGAGVGALLGSGLPGFWSAALGGAGAVFGVYLAVFVPGK